MDQFVSDFLRNAGSPLGNLILQILVILLAARVCGFLMRFLGQPQVVGEIIAGICLGPSLLGPALPEVHAYLFPDGSMQRLYFLSQVGVLLFMFVVGLELDFRLLRSRARSAVVISQVSIVVPCLLGVGLAFLLYDQYGMPERGLLSFALFMGIAMSITAFPVLARIVQEHGLSRTPIGTTAITCAAVDDVTAWCLLAFVVGLVQSGSGANAVWTIGSALGYALLMLLVVRPFLHTRLGPRLQGAEPSLAVLSLVFMAMLLSAFVTEAIGIHALFGAFLLGVVIPEHNRFKEKLIARVQDVTTVVLLPLFFTFTGLRTQLGLLDDAQSWLICGLVVLVAVLGKVGGAVAAARLTGYNWRMSWMLGALMNTRGLMELIVLNIGYDLGILSPKIFTMMVVMAVVTTMMTGPIVRLLNLPDQQWSDTGRLGDNKTV